MNGQSQWLFEAPPILEATPYSDLEYYNPSPLGKADICPGYKPGEEKKSIQTGFLKHTVSLHAPDKLLIADFGVNSSFVKVSTKKEDLLKNWLNTFENDPNYQLRIIGYSDCVGDKSNKREKNNKFLREGRAKRVYELLGKGARKRVESVNAAPLGTYVPDTNNSTVEGRAKNRGVIIEFWKKMSDLPDIASINNSCDNLFLDTIKRAIKLSSSPQGIAIFAKSRPIKFEGLVIAKRMTCLLPRLLLKNADDRYLSFSQVHYNLDPNMVAQKNIVWLKVTSFIKQSCVKLLRQKKSLSDQEIIEVLIRLDDQITGGLQTINQIRQHPPKFPRIFARIKFNSIDYEVARLKTIPNTIYSCYVDIQPPIQSSLPNQPMPIPIPRWHTPTIKPSNWDIFPPDPNSNNWVWPSLKAAATGLGVTISIGLRALSTLSVSKALEAAWLIFEFEEAPLNTMFGLAGEAAAKAILSKTLGVDPSLVMNLNDFIESNNFPVLDLASPLGFASVKVRAVASKVITDEVREKALLMYQNDLWDIAIGDHPKANRKLNKAVDMLLKNRTKLSKVWPKDLTDSSREGIRKYIKEKSLLFVPNDHWQLLKQSRGANLYKRLKNNTKLLDQLGIKNDKNDTQLIAFINRQIDRIRPLGVTSTDLRVIAETAANNLPADQGARWRAKYSKVMSTKKQKEGEFLFELLNNGGFKDEQAKPVVI